MTDNRSPDSGTSFAATLTRLRQARRLNKKQLARAIGFDPSYVSHMENGRHRPTHQFAIRADAVLDAGGALLAAFEQFRARSGGAGTTGDQPSWPGIPAGLVVRSEHAELTRRDDGYYQISIVRDIYNGTNEPVTRFPVRIEVDVHPTDSLRSQLFYRDNPVTLEEIDFRATLDGAPTGWDVARNRDAYKKIYVRTEPNGFPSPIYPRESAVLCCMYRVPCTKWGDWFEREIRWPTEQLSVSLGFPERLEVRLTAREVTWGGDRPLPARGDSWVREGVRYHSWSTARPALTNQYRFDWQLAS